MADNTLTIQLNADLVTVGSAHIEIAETLRIPNEQVLDCSPVGDQVCIKVRY